MKKLYTLLLFTVCYIAISQQDSYVRVDGKRFIVGGNTFFPIVCNYGIEVLHTGAANPNPWTFGYNFPTRIHNQFTANTFATVSDSAAAFNIMLRDFKDIKAIGFNTLRIYGTNYGDLQSFDPYLNTFDNLVYTDVRLNALRLDIIDNILNAAKQAGLKVILLIDGNKFSGPQSSYTNYLSQLAQRFKYNTTLMAVDFSNEPGGIYKTPPCNLTSSWSNAIKSNSQILTTIGFWGVESVFGWDANTVDVDFASFHDYPGFETPDNPDLDSAIKRIKSSYLWYQRNVSKPWIVGETAISAHINQTIPISHVLDPTGFAGTLGMQASYLDATIKACRDYGGAGYSWWVYMDCTTCPEYAGLLPINSGNTNTAVLTPTSTWKPAASAIFSFNPNSLPVPFPSSTENSKYFQSVSFNSNYKISGTVTSGGAPLKDALVVLHGFITNTCTPQSAACTPSSVFYVSCNQTATCSNNGTVLACPNYTNCGDVELGRSFTNSQGEYTVYANSSVNTSSFTNGLYNYLIFAAPDCKTEWAPYYPPQTQTLNATFNISMIKVNRPNTMNLAYSNQTVNAVNTNTFATNSITFSNYVINSGTFNSKASSNIVLNTGFKVKIGSNFSARIGQYNHNCSDLVSGSPPVAFKTVQTNTIQEESFSASLYPNPSDGHYNIKTEEVKFYHVEVYNLYGANIEKFSFYGSETKLDLTRNVAGLYFVVLEENRSVIKSWKVIKD